MEIKKEVTVTLTPKDLKEIIRIHLAKMHLEATNIYFSIGAHEMEGDHKSEFPQVHSLDAVICSAKEL